jgi:tagatose 1,6-diphosphate aldolase GatY/KbaY
MDARFTELLQEAAAAGRAVGAFTCYDSTQAAGVLDAAEQAGVGVILLISPGSFRQPRGADLLAAVRTLADRSPVPACVQLDHVSELDAVRAAFAAGAGAVMVDGSHLPWEENVALTGAAVEIGRGHGGEVECELGGIAGHEDVAQAIAAGALTEPGEAAEFAARTGAACLAVSIGNVHGHYRDAPALDFGRLDEIRAATAIALSLHGASGLPADQVRRSLASGVVKVNVNTELRTRYLAALEEGLEGWRAGADVQSLVTAARAATAEAVAQTLVQLDPSTLDASTIDRLTTP